MIVSPGGAGIAAHGAELRQGVGRVPRAAEEAGRGGVGVVVVLRLRAGAVEAEDLAHDRAPTQRNRRRPGVFWRPLLDVRVEAAGLERDVVAAQARDFDRGQLVGGVADAELAVGVAPEGHDRAGALEHVLRHTQQAVRRGASARGA